MQHMFLFIVHVTLITGVLGTCPSDTPGLLRWSDPGTWPTGKPIERDDVIISGAMLLDESPPSLGDLLITENGRLVFDPSTPLQLRAANIIINGSLEAGSEDCLYDNELTITLTGTRSSHFGELEPKVILVHEGGSLELHGRRKLSWTKLNGTQTATNGDDPSVLFDHEDFKVNNPSIPVSTWMDRDWVGGLGAYTIRIDELGQPSIKMFGVYDLSQEGENLAEQIAEVEDGEILMLAVQKFLKLKKSSEEQVLVFDALEQLLYGEINYGSTLRTADQKTTYVLVYQKGSNPELLSEATGRVGRKGEAISASITVGDLVFTASSVPSGRRNVDGFTITTADAKFPLIDVIDDVSSWNPGDRVVIASTDYSWSQAEERTLVECDDCAGNQFRIDSPLKYTHWGEFMHTAVDMRAEIGLLTRNIVIEGTVLDRCPAYNDNCNRKQVRDLDTFGGHIKIMQGFSTVHIEGVELRRMGQQTDNGRYPVHFHMCLHPDSPPYVRESSIHESFARCITVHGTHDVQIQDVFCYNHMGHGFFLEDGGEKNNTLDGNLAISTRFGTGLLEPLDNELPTSFWMTNPTTRFLNNVAAGSEGAGVWFLYPQMPLAPSRDLDLMAEYEARRTKIQDIYNIVAHSNSGIGITLGSRLGEDRRPIPANHWQPRADPNNSMSQPLEFSIQKLTGYKNRLNNIWIEAGMVTVSKVSSSDSLNGITVTNDGLVDEFTGKLTDSVIIGDSENRGVPDSIPARSLPLEDKVDEPQSGLTLWKGPTRVSNVWFGGRFYSNHYDVGAIAMKRFSPYFFSVQTMLTNMLFSFDDVSGGDRRAISGLEGLDRGWKSRDGALMAGFTLNNTEPGLAQPTYVVRPDHLSAAADDCRVRDHWRLALCSTKYGNLKLLSSSPATFVRHDLPAAQLWFQMAGNGGPQVVLDGSRVYTVHFETTIPTKLVFTGEGMERGDVLTIGVCLPRDATFVIKRTVPETIKPGDFVYVDSLKEVQNSSNIDGRKIYHNTKKGMLYYKFIDSREKAAGGEMYPCVDGECPNLVLDEITGDMGDADCRKRVYGDDRNKDLPPQQKHKGVIPSNAGLTPPEGWGAGSTRPFTTRDPVDGGYSDWTEWSTCSLTCGEGVRTRVRKCDSPIPSYGGRPCDGASRETEACSGENCSVDGGFTLWSGWGGCTTHTERDCQGMAERTRTCSNPTPQNNGLGCQGSVAEVKTCDTCPEE